MKKVEHHSAVFLWPGLWVPYAILLVLGVWFILAVTGVLRSWSLGASKILPGWAILTAALTVPILGALCALHSLLQLKGRVVAIILLLVTVPMLPVAFDTHPVLITFVVFATVLEAFAIPVINRRWLSRRAHAGVG